MLSPYHAHRELVQLTQDVIAILDILQHEIALATPLKLALQNDALWEDVAWIAGQYRETEVIADLLWEASATRGILIDRVTESYSQI